MVSSGNSEVGAAKLTGEVMDIITKVPNMVKTLTGVDVSKTLIESTHPVRPSRTTPPTRR
ncbi:UNVERIFIED_CONTAM: hypothetical protein GTU68_045862 [Idotea baltica]|nr:hypothetical protein [Idotea baltica]